MMWLTEQQLDRLPRRAARVMLAGMLWGVVAIHFLDVSFGVLSCFMAIGMGASVGSLREWRIDQGLWMLAGLFLAFTIPLYILLVWYGVFRGQGQPILVTIDIALGTWVMGYHVRFLLTVIKLNWRVREDASNEQVAY